MIERSKRWLGERNGRAFAATPDAPAQVGLYGTTLREREVEP
jgi:hypothetical protein